MVNKRYTDAYGKIHNTVGILSSGGQGAVFRTTDDNIVVKIEINSNSQEPIKSDDNTIEKINNLIYLPIPENGINITLPIALINEYSGYIMQLLNDMKPFSTTFNISNDMGEREYKNDWLKTLPAPDGLKNFFDDYINSGGAIRRFNAYFKIACYLAKLHAQGLVYCDISDNNMFISENIDSNEVWLIDADNINFQIRTLKTGYYTPGYGAPEVIERRGCSFYSDSYALLVSFFWQTFGVHPFKGAMVYADDDWDDENDLESQAFSGKFPWILNRNDNSNIGKTSIPIEIFNKNIFDILDRMFSHEGINNLYKRPSMAEIATELSTGLNQLINCDNCKMDFDFFENDCCPYCDNDEIELLQVKTYYFDKNKQDNKGELVQKFVCNLMPKNDIPLRIITNNPIEDIDKVALYISKNNKSKNYILTKEIELIDVYINETHQYLLGKYELINKEFSCIVTHNNIKKILQLSIGGS